MNESKCKCCDTDLVWKGSLMDGRAECPACDSQPEEGYWTPTIGIDYAAGATPAYFTDIVKEMLAKNAKSNKLYVHELKMSPGKLDEWTQEYSLTPRTYTPTGRLPKKHHPEYHGVSTGRRSGRTTRMLTQVTKMREPCIVVMCNSREVTLAMQGLVEVMMCDKVGPNTLVSRTGCYISVVSAGLPFSDIMRGSPRTTFIDHAVALKDKMHIVGCAKFRGVECITDL